MRRNLLALIGVETAFWLYLTVGGLNDALFFAKGYGSDAALLASIVFGLFVVPALVLTLYNRLLMVAAILAGGAAVLYAFDPALRLIALIVG